MNRGLRNAARFLLVVALIVVLIGAYLAIRQHTDEQSCTFANQMIEVTRITNPSAKIQACGVRGLTWGVLAAGIGIAVIGTAMLIGSQGRNTGA